MFITIDGPDGSGKTTAAKLLAQSLCRDVATTHYTSEPTSSPTGRLIREILAEGGERASMLTELFVRDRAEHLRDYILPLSEQGDIVVCDRYKYSTMVYQQLQGESPDRLLSLNGHFAAPDIAFILTVSDVDILLGRIGGRGLEREVFETRETILRSLDLYAKMPEYFPGENIVYISAEGTPEDTAAQMYDAIRSRLSQ